MRTPNSTHGEAHEADGLNLFHPAVRQWFADAFAEPTLPQRLSWPAIARGESTLLLAPTGTGKTLAAFLWCLNRAMFSPPPPAAQRCRALYISPLRALAVDVERNLSAPLEAIARVAQQRGDSFHRPSLFVRTADTSPAERSRFLRTSADILITTPESLYLLLTSGARQALRSVECVIVDEIHALVAGKRGAHLALSLERLEHWCGRPLQRIGLSATQRPLEEVARFLGGVERGVEAFPDDGLSAGPSNAARAASPQGFAQGPGEELPAHQLPTGELPLRELALRDREDAAEPPFTLRYRPVTVIDAHAPKRLDLSVQVPVEVMSSLAQSSTKSSTMSSTPAAPGARSIWSSIHPELLRLVREHSSTLIFVNSRRLAERISGALNDLAGETLVLAHHGSVAPAQRREIEEQLKRGALKGLVATSSLELGIDMGAIDLVVQIEAPPSVASGMQRIGRAGHHVGAVSHGVIFPKFRADLLACAAATEAMRRGEVESIRYPRNPLDVLAQQIVATVAMDPMPVAELFAMMRRAAPFATLSPASFESVLDLLSGRYPSEEFAELRPRITWDRITQRLTPRQSAQRIALLNGGTIPDRGLYGVFLAGAEKPTRLGELDEEMVFETKPGETILLGASSWRIAEITPDRVLVSPAPGEPGKMPFWYGDNAARPAEFGQHIGALARELLAMPAPAAFDRLVEEHSLAPNAADNLLRYLRDQQAAAGCVPSDEQILIERCRDELGDWRICVLSPYGSRVHAPWCIAVAAALQAQLGVGAQTNGPQTNAPQTMWTDDGFVVRLPESDQPPDAALFVPPARGIRDAVMAQLASTSLFAASFRQNAARALLLPRRRPGLRTPLWQQRKRAADLLAVASRYPSFPILLESYRECMRDVFDLDALAVLLGRIEGGSVRVTTVDSERPSPFAASLLFGYVANYIYDGDAPLAERRAQALAIDQAQLEELLGDADFRELLDPEVLHEFERRLQRLADAQPATESPCHPDEIHDLLLRLGDLSYRELSLRCGEAELASAVESLAQARRIVPVEIAPVEIAGEVRYVAVEHAAQYRDALGALLPEGLPAVFLAARSAPLAELISRYARTHGPFTVADLGRRYRLPAARIESALGELTRAGTLLEGGFRPGGSHREWIRPELLQQLRRLTLARLRRQVAPLEPRVLGVFLPRWQGVGSMRRGWAGEQETANAAPAGAAVRGTRLDAQLDTQLDTSLEALLEVMESLQGVALPLSEWEREILPARIRRYQPAALDALIAAGDLVWVGRGALGERDGRLALYLAESLGELLPPDELPAPTGFEERQLDERAQRIADFLATHGASFFAPIHQAAGGGYPGETIDALWQLAWQGAVTNDTFQVLRGFLDQGARGERDGRAHRRASGIPAGSPFFVEQFRARSRGGAIAQGRWSLVRSRIHSRPSHSQSSHSRSSISQPSHSQSSVTAWSAAVARQLLLRYGLVTRECAAAEELPGGFAILYPALRQMEERGWVRRGIFVAGLGGSQFALDSAVESLRALSADGPTDGPAAVPRNAPARADVPQSTLLAAVDPANPYGSLLPWPRPADATPADATPADASPANAAHANAAPAAHGMARVAGASVLLVGGELVAYLRRGNPALKLFLPASEPEREACARAAAGELARLAQRRLLLSAAERAGVLIAEINSAPAHQHYFGEFLRQAGFVLTPLGYQMRHQMRRPRWGASGAASEGASEPESTESAEPQGEAE